MNKAEILGLATRVEGEPASREVDAIVAAALRVGTEYSWALNYPAWIAMPDGRVQLEKHGPSFAAPAYTSSIDAAMGLVPEGVLLVLKQLWGEGGKREWYATLNVYSDNMWRDSHDALHPLAPIALTAACLKAIASTMEDDRG